MAGAKRYPASRRRLEKARKDGDVAKSRELSICFQLLVCAFWVRAGGLGLSELRSLTEICAGGARDFHTNNMLVSFKDACLVWCGSVLPILLIASVAV